MKTMGRRIQEKRIETGLSQEDLGKRLGVLRQTIGKWESGDVQNIKRSYIAKMAEIFHCDPVWLMGFEDAPKVDLKYSAPGQEDIVVEVDKAPIMGDSSLLVRLYEYATRLHGVKLAVAVDVLKSLVEEDQISGE